ncbi:P protein-like [Liolophura sinensis]|uniref:P protein-like n=1 Tax=Liolophura sinensis TaxID=3198878 RepID=UPI003158B3B3
MARTQFMTAGTRDEMFCPQLPQAGRVLPPTKEKTDPGELTPLLESKKSKQPSVDSKTAEEDFNDNLPNRRGIGISIFKKIKMVTLLGLASTAFIVIMINPELSLEQYQICVSMKEPHALDMLHKEETTIEFLIHAPVLDADAINSTMRKTMPKLTITINTSEPWDLYLDENALRTGNQKAFKHEFSCCLSTHGGSYQIFFSTDWEESIPIVFSYHPLNSLVHEQVVLAAIILACVYFLIIFEIVHRTLAAILGSMATVAVLASLNERPTLEEIMSWLDVETLALLFGMMIIVAIFSETGFFDYCALVAYKIAKGKVWPLITLLCVFAGVVSAFLDNVTTILLLTPVTIRLCQVLDLDPRKILIAEVLFSNIGGTATAIGDPPNVIIVSNQELAEKGINFSSFTEHMVVGIVFISIAGYGLLRVFYRNVKLLQNQDPPELRELQQEIAQWRRAAHHIVVASREESMVRALLLQKVATLETLMRNQIYKRKARETKDFEASVEDLEKKCRITDYVLLGKSGVVIVLVILAFFLHSFIESMYVGLGWIAIMGATLLLVLADISDMESILHRVEWATLLFFAALFTLMEGLAKLGLIDWLGDQMGLVVSLVSDEHRLTVAIIAILWISAIASSFIDNIPYTTAMVPVLVKLSEDSRLNLPIMPLVLALAFGACLGGNGTLIGASANVVCAGIAEQHGYGFSFIEFFKIGFPMMLVTTLVSMVYLLICHVALQWH